MGEGWELSGRGTEGVGTRKAGPTLPPPESREEPAELRLGPDRDPGGGAGLMGENIRPPKSVGQSTGSGNCREKREVGKLCLHLIVRVRERTPWYVLLRKEPPARRNDTASKIRLGSLSSPKSKSRPTQGGFVLPQW